MKRLREYGKEQNEEKKQLHSSNPKTELKPYTMDSKGDHDFEKKRRRQVNDLNLWEVSKKIDLG